MCAYIYNRKGSGVYRCVCVAVKRYDKNSELYLCLLLLSIIVLMYCII